MKQKLSKLLFSFAKKNWDDLDEKEVIFIVDKNYGGKENPDKMVFGIGIKGLTTAYSNYLHTFWSGLFKNTEYAYLDQGSWVGYTFKDGYGIIYILSSVKLWDIDMQKQANDWQNIDLFGEKKGFLSKCLSWVRNITTTQVMTLILIVNTLIFILLGVILRNNFIR
jgi:hypothetical protein